MAVITNAYSNVVSSFYSSKFSRYIEELLVSPTPNWVILAGYVTGGLARGLTVGIAVTLVALAFTEIQLHSVVVTVLVLTLTAVLFSLGGFINAVYANSFDDISIVPTFVLTPLTYLGGVFYSIDLLPEPWHTLSLANPVLYMVNAFRYGLQGVTDIPLWIAFLLSRRPPNRRFTYGYGRAEDLAGLAVVLMILLSAVIAGRESILRLYEPQQVRNLWAVAAAAVIGFLGNEAVAIFRLRVSDGFSKC